MKRGSLLNLVEFQRRSQRLNAFGESKDRWSVITTDLVSIEPLSGREFFTALQTQTDISVRIVCGYSAAVAAVKAQDRIVHGETIYDIRHPPIDKDMRHRELHFMCTVHVE